VVSEKRGSQVFYRLVCSCIESFFGCVESVLEGNARRGESVVRSCRRGACRGVAADSRV
jgi:hypothetical protein